MNKGYLILPILAILAGCGGESYEILGGNTVGGGVPIPAPTPTSGCTSNCGGGVDEFANALQYDFTLRAPGTTGDSLVINVETDSILKLKIVAEDAPQIQGYTAYNCMTVRTGIVGQASTTRTPAVRREGATECLAPWYHPNIPVGVTESVINLSNRLSPSGGTASYQIKLDEATNDFRCFSTNPGQPTYNWLGQLNLYNCNQSPVYNPNNGQPTHKVKGRIYILTNETAI